jgi:gamma-glutamylcysteine synthetase
MERIEIIIQGTSKVDKTALYNSIRQGLEGLEFRPVDLNPIPSLGMSNRAILYGQEMHLDLYTLDVDQVKQ